MDHKDLAIKACTDLNFTFYDLLWKNNTLVIYINKPEGIVIKDCVRFDKYYTKLLESYNLINDNLVLEVSSPGINRILRTKEHFLNVLGQMIKVKTQSGSLHVGILTEVLEDSLIVGSSSIAFYDILKANQEGDV